MSPVSVVHIPTSFAGVTVAADPATGASIFNPPPPPEASPFTDPDFGAKVLALLVLDDRFAREAASYIKPAHFLGPIDQNFAKIILDFIRRYGQLPGDARVVFDVIKTNPAIPANEMRLYAERLVSLARINEGMKERGWVRDRAIDFCKRQALLSLASMIPDLLSKPNADFGKIRDELNRTMQIGEGAQAQFRDFFAETEKRRERRHEVATGTGVRRGVPTGITYGRYALDDLLYHKGWERAALTVIMARAKAGKTTFCLQSAIQSSLESGSNWLCISLEVSEDIVEDRGDAMLTGVRMSDLLASRDLVANKVSAMPKTGKFYIERFPSNTLTTDAVDALVGRYFDNGIKLDGVVVDYIGIMRLIPSDDRYLGLGNAGKELRRIAGKYDVAMLTPAQTKREGVNKANLSMDQIGESFAIVQDCDLLLALNATDQEVAAGVRRLSVAASRNTGNFTVKVKSNMEAMRIVEDILDVSYE